jgi:hypothetical protein
MLDKCRGHTDWPHEIGRDGIDHQLVVYAGIVEDERRFSAFL